MIRYWVAAAAVLGLLAPAARAEEQTVTVQLVRSIAQAPFYIAYDVSCPTGAYATGDGFNGGPTATLLSGPAPDKGYTDWSISGGGGITVYAVCAKFLRQ